jgi:phage gpG-like protein
MGIRIDISGQGQIQANANRTKEEIRRKVKAALVEIALVDIETGAKQKLDSDGHIDTGRLRASLHTEYEGNRGHNYSDDFGNGYSGELTAAVGENDVIVGTNVHYAKYIERMDSFIKYAFEKAKPKIANAISQRVNI